MFVAIALIVGGGVGTLAGLALFPAVTLLHLLLARVIAEALVVYFRLRCVAVRELRDRQAIPAL